MHGDDVEGREWFREDILKGGGEWLRLWSGEIGDEVAKLKFWR